tara:strand:- start:266 stop:1003 length:738 start_codon:yes stop_codon:yes gene_type:complete
MKFKILFIFFLIISCTPQFSTYNQKEIYTSKGFALIYNNNDYQNKVIKRKLNNDIMQISHQNLKTGTLIKISNPKNNESIVLKNIKRIKYPDFYKILITKAVADKLSLDLDLPLLEIIEIRKNKSFIAKKAKIYNEEKKIPSKAPVASVQISNISKNKKDASIKKRNQFYMLIGTFYSEDTALFLKDRIIKDIPDLDSKLIKTKKIANKKTQVFSGPYTTINLVKNDYIKLKNFGFEKLDIFIDE